MAALLLGPGAGHVVMRRTRAGLLWLAAALVLILAAALAVVAASPILFATATVLAVGIRVAAAIEPAVRKPGPQGVPGRPRLALVLGFGATFWGTSLTVTWTIASAFKAPSGSMSPSMLPGDSLMVSRVSGVRRGDVVVFAYPKDPRIQYVKRVVGLAGDRIEIRDGALIVNDAAIPRRPLGEACPSDGYGTGPAELPAACRVFEEELDGQRYRIQQEDGTGGFESMLATEVPSGHMFVLGDNRDNSSDSRHWGTVAMDRLVGRAMFVTWSRDAEGRMRWSRAGARL